MVTLKSLEPEQRHGIVRRVKDDAELSLRYTILLTLSTIIATFGLLVDSAAVVIGAMIIAPLMGPILGLSLGMVRGAQGLQRSALLAEAIGVALCVAIAFLIGQIPFTLGISREMLARTQPTTFDIAIALASGLAGAYASVNEKVSATIAGVAISVALVPPLASSGLLFALGRPDLGAGAFLLWFVNFLSIQLAAAAVYTVYGFARTDTASPEAKRRWILRFGPSIAALGLVGWFLTTTLLSLIETHRIERLCERVLSAQLAQRTGGRLSELIEIRRSGGGWEIVASTLTPRPFEPWQVQEIESELRRSGVPGPKLILRSIVSQDASANGKVFYDAREARQSREASEAAATLAKVRESIDRSLQDHEALELAEVEVGSEHGPLRVTAVVRAPKPVEPDQVRAAEAAIREVVGRDVRLVVRSVNVRDADREAFLHRPAQEPPDEEVQELRSRVEPVVRDRLEAAGLRLIELALTRSDESIQASAEVEAGSPPAQAVANDLETELRSMVDPRLRLIIRARLVLVAQPNEP